VPVAYLADLDDGQAMYAKAPLARRPIASLTKIMTAVTRATRVSLARRGRVVRAQVSGTLDEPVILGQAKIADGRLRYVSLPHSLEAVNGSILFDSRNIRVDGVTAQMAGGVVTFDGLVDGLEHLALGLGRYAEALEPCAASAAVPLVRPHSECLTGDVFGSQRCDCGPQLREAVERIAEAGGYLLYLRQEGRGIGLYSKLDAYLLQDSGLDTYEANLALGHAEDERDYTAAAQMLNALKVDSVALLSNNPDKAAQLERLGLTVCERVPTGVHRSPTNARYLAAKAHRGAHLLDLDLGHRPA